MTDLKEVVCSSIVGVFSHTVWAEAARAIHAKVILFILFFLAMALALFEELACKQRLQPRGQWSAPLFHIAIFKQAFELDYWKQKEKKVTVD